MDNSRQALPQPEFVSSFPSVSSAPSVDESRFRHIAYFVSAHGFGHATRACAVMAAAHALEPDLCFDIFTAAPEFVFRDSLTGLFAYHHAITDIGMVQTSALVEDADATLARLDEFLPFEPSRLGSGADWLTRLRCELVVCDIAPLGLAVARTAGLRSLLIENFTWDWIYQGYLPEAPGLRRHSDYLAETYATARYHLQAEPFCLPAARASGRLKPIGRRPRSTVAATRAALGLEPGERLVLVTLGGVPDQPPIPAGTPEPGVVYALAGLSETLRREGAWLLMPHYSGVYFPDLLEASDAVIGKLGYSTLAEAYHAGVPFGYIARPRFPESSILAAFAQRALPSAPLAVDTFLRGDWLPIARALLEMPRAQRPTTNGADRAAQFIVDLL